MGAPVEFYVFEDDAGLGAEECSTDGRPAGNWGKLGSISLKGNTYWCFVGNGGVIHRNY